MTACLYDSPIGSICIKADSGALTEVSFARPESVLPDARTSVDACIRRAAEWLDVYFSGRDPGPTPRLCFDGCTPFRRRVYAELVKVPFASVVTYGELARRVGCTGKTAPRAIGGAVGHNPIVIFAPCHRVVGADGTLTGFTGGLDIKAALLNTEGIAVETDRAKGLHCAKILI